jgi:small conductance mechanosensitive channel
MTVAADSKNVQTRAHRRRLLKRCTVYKLVTLTVIFAGLFVVISTLMPIVLSSYHQYSMYFYLAQLGIAGFLVIRTISKLAYGLIVDASESQARSARGIIVIVGYLAVVAIAISIMAQSPTVTVVIGTVTAIILGVSMQSLLGNAIAGMVLAITRPFRIGDSITVFGNTGRVYDIGLLYTTMTAPEEEGKIVLVPNTSLLTTAIVKEKRRGTRASSETTAA